MFRRMLSVALVVGLAACGAGEELSDGAITSTTEPQVSGSGGGDAIDVDVCSLLTLDELRRLGVEVEPPEGEDDLGVAAHDVAAAPAGTTVAAGASDRALTISWPASLPASTRNASSTSVSARSKPLLACGPVSIEAQKQVASARVQFTAITKSPARRTS